VNLPNSFELYLFALAAGVTGFLIGGNIEIRIYNRTRPLPSKLRSWPVVVILLAIGAVFVVVFQEAGRVCTILSGFSLGFLIRKWWSKQAGETDNIED